MARRILIGSSLLVGLIGCQSTPPSNRGNYELALYQQRIQRQLDDLGAAQTSLQTLNLRVAAQLEDSQGRQIEVSRLLGEIARRQARAECATAAIRSEVECLTLLHGVPGGPQFDQNMITCLRQRIDPGGANC